MMMIMWIAALSARNAFQWIDGRTLYIMCIMCDKCDYCADIVKEN